MTPQNEPETEYDYNLGQGRSPEHNDRNETIGAIIVICILFFGAMYIFYEIFKS